MADAATVIARHAPRSVSPEVAAFSRQVVATAQPSSGERARALLFSASSLGRFCESVGVPLAAHSALSVPVIERFSVLAAGRLCRSTVRTQRANLRFLARANLGGPEPLPISRERSAFPYSEAEISRYLDLARHQPTQSRRWHCCALVALGAGAGLMAPDFRTLRGTDLCVSGSLVSVSVRGVRPRVVPLRQAFNEVVLAAAQFAGADFVIGGNVSTRRNVTTPLVSALAGGDDLERLSMRRLRATWLDAGARAIGLGGFLAAAGLSCPQRLGDLVAASQDKGRDITWLLATAT